MTISAASSKSAVPLIVVGARFNLAHSFSNLPGFGMDELLILLLVDSSTYANCVNCSTATILLMKHGSIDSEYFAILLLLVSNALNLEMCTTESAPSKILRIKGNSGFLLVVFHNRPSLLFLSSFFGMRLLVEKFFLFCHSFCSMVSLLLKGLRIPLNFPRRFPLNSILSVSKRGSS